MTEEFIQHSYDAALPSDSVVHMPLVSLEECRLFQRTIGDRVQRGSTAAANIDSIDFGAAGEIYMDVCPLAAFRSTSLVHPLDLPSSPREVPRQSDRREHERQILPREPRQILQQALDHMPASLRSSVMRDIETLASPGRVPPLDAVQLDRIFTATSHLLHDPNRTSPLNLANRQLLAAGIFDNAAHPRDIDQGAFNTCNVTTIEERLNTLNPALAAEIVVQVGLTGAYVAADGFRSRLDRRSLVPDAESRIPPSDPAADGRRNFASQIFSIAMINDHWQRYDSSMLYTQNAPPNSNERAREVLIRNGQVIADSPRLSLRAMSAISDRLGFERGSIWGAYGARDADERDGTVVIRSESDLQARLENAHRSGRFPVIAGVELDGPMFGNGQHDGGPQGHVISIVGFNALAGTVQISNQYGRNDDLQNVSVRNLYLSMIPRRLRPQL